jgi:lysyl-tRNA synthetase class 1
VDVAGRVTAEKGSELSVEERRILAERLAAVGGWLDSYAPECARIEIRRDALPPEAAALGEDQRAWLGALALAAEETPPSSGDAWQALIFALAEAAALPAGRAFGALYVAFLGRTNGPRAGWLLASLEPGFVVDRLRAAAGWRDLPRAEGGAAGGAGGAGTTEAVG